MSGADEQQAEHRVTDPANASPPEATPAALVNIVGICEIQDLLIKVGRGQVLDLTYRDDFPEPAAELAGGDVWLREDVEIWINDHGDALADMLRQAVPIVRRP